jgi:hypothetical protein
MERQAQSFYREQALRQGARNIHELSTLSGNYATAAELEADFNQRVAAVRQEIQSLQATHHQHVQSAIMETMVDANAPVGVAVAASVIGSLVTDAQQARAEREARERLERQRAAAAADLERRRVAAQLQMRQTLLAQFPEGGTPLSRHRVEADVLYFFSYSLDAGGIQQAAPVVAVTNTFPIARRGDGSWPLKTMVVDEIRTPVRGQKTLVGYYTTREMAESMRQAFIRIAGQSGLAVQEIEHAGRPLRPTSAGRAGREGVDEWGTRSGSSQRVDEWNSQSSQDAAPTSAPQDDWAPNPRHVEPRPSRIQSDDWAPRPGL